MNRNISRAVRLFFATLLVLCGAVRGDDINSYRKIIAFYPETYSSSCTMATDAIPCIQAAINASAFSSGGAPFLGLVKLRPNTSYNVGATGVSILMDNAYGPIFDCGGSTLNWSGAAPANIPLFLVTNVARPVFKNCKIQTSVPLQAAFEFANKDITHITATGPVLEHISVYGTDFAHTFQYGVRFSNRYDGYSVTGSGGSFAGSTGTITVTPTPSINLNGASLFDPNNNTLYTGCTIASGNATISTCYSAGSAPANGDAVNPTANVTHDANNDQSRINDSLFALCGSSCISIEHTQSLQHEFHQTRGTGVLNSGAIVAGTAFINNSAGGGSFFSIGGHKDGFDTVYRIGVPYANDVIENDDVENSLHYLTTTVNFGGASAPVFVRNGRYSVGGLAANCRMIDFERMGPLTVDNMHFDGDLSGSGCGASGAPLIYVYPNISAGAVTNVVARNDSFVWTQGSNNADVFSIDPTKARLSAYDLNCRDATTSRIVRCWTSTLKANIAASSVTGGTLKRTILLLGDSYAENHFNHVGITGLTSSGNTVTITSTKDVPAGTKVTIGHFTDECLNGMQTVATRISSTQFTYTAPVCTPAGTTWTVQATPSGNFAVGTATGTFTLNANPTSTNLAGAGVLDNSNGITYSCGTQVGAVFSNCKDPSGSATAPGVNDVIGAIALRGVDDLIFNQALADNGWFNWYNALSGGGWDVIGDAGIGASLIADVPLQIQRDIFTQMPAWALLLIGTNDVGGIGSVSPSLCNAFLASYQAAVRTMTAQGIRVLGVTVPPRSTNIANSGASATRRTNAAYINQKLKEWSRTEPGFFLMDQHDAVIDAYQTGDVEVWGRHGDTETNYSTDGIHPSASGAYYIAKRFLGLPSQYKIATGTTSGTFTLSSSTGTFGVGYPWPGPTGPTVFNVTSPLGLGRPQVSCTATAASATLASCSINATTTNPAAALQPVDGDYLQTVAPPPLNGLASTLAPQESILPCNSVEDVTVASGRNQIAPNPLMNGSVAVSGSNTFGYTAGMSGTLPTSWLFVQDLGTTTVAPLIRQDGCGYDTDVLWTAGPNPGNQALKTPNLISNLAANDQVYAVVEINPKGYAYFSGLSLGTYMNGTNSTSVYTDVLSTCLASSGAYQRFDQAIAGPITCRTPPITVTAAMTDLRFGVDIQSGTTSAGELRIGRFAVYRK